MASWRPLTPRLWALLTPLLLASQAAALHSPRLTEELAPLRAQAAPASREASLWRSSSDKIDLLGALADNPPGSFVQLMGPVSEAVGLSYNATSADDYQPSMQNNTIDEAYGGGEVWERLFDLEVDPLDGGVHATVFASHAARRAIVAYRGMCMNIALQQCKVDHCFGLKVKGNGELSSSSYSVSEAACAEFEDKMNYGEQAMAVVTSVQERYPGYRVLLVGHSLGGFLAQVTAAQRPDELQAITFAPTPFRYALTSLYGFTNETLAALPHEDLVSTCDRYDCGWNTLSVDEPRAGSMTCLYLDVEEPKSCSMVPVAPYGSDPNWREELKRQVVPMTLCKVNAHHWPRYETVVKSTQADGSAAHKPTCSLDFSV